MEEYKANIENKPLNSDESDTKIEQLIKYIRKTALFRQVVPMEAAAGWPIPVLKNNEVYVVVPFYGVTVKGKGKTSIYPPLCTISVQWSNKVVVEYVNLRYNNSMPGGQWEKEAGSFPHEAISKMTVREYKKTKKELMELYDTMLDNLNKGNELSSQQEVRFRELLKILVEPGLIPFYKSINSEFFEFI
jgi:hypothetical protein